MAEEAAVLAAEVEASIHPDASSPRKRRLPDDVDDDSHQEKATKYDAISGTRQTDQQSAGIKKESDSDRLEEQSAFNTYHSGEVHHGEVDIKPVASIAPC